MSRTKQALPEGFSVLTGDELDGSPDVTEPTNEELAVGFAMQDLTKAVQTLKQYKPLDCYDEIDKAQADLAELIADMDKPF